VTRRKLLKIELKIDPRNPRESHTYATLLLSADQQLTVVDIDAVHRSFFGSLSGHQSDRLLQDTHQSTAESSDASL
jgi:hypothetical protein